MQFSCICRILLYLQHDCIYDMKVLMKHMDFVGSFLAGLCAIHCLLIPLAISLSALSISTFLSDPIVQSSFIMSGIIAAVVALFVGIRKHRTYSVLWLSLLGFALLISAEFIAGPVHLPLSLCGAFLVILAHLRNHKLQKELGS